MSLKHELQGIISGDGTARHGEIIQTISNYLRREKEAVSQLEESKLNKPQETKRLIEFIKTNGLWYTEIDLEKYIGEGAEQRVYEFNDPTFIVKLNDSIYYESWQDYFHSLLLHNYFFPHLAYELLGFWNTDRLYAVVKQPFVTATESTNLDHVKEFLSANGFINRRNNDYFHPGLGIILEDLHDENVLTEEGVLQFIDTVFYVLPSFFDKE